jgi:hypothetical protein
MFFTILFLRLKFACSLTENFSLVINVTNCRQFNVYKRGTLAQVHTFVKQAKSVLLAYTALFNFA